MSHCKWSTGVLLRTWETPWTGLVRNDLWSDHFKSSTNLGQMNADWEHYVLLRHTVMKPVPSQRPHDLAVNAFYQHLETGWLDSLMLFFSLSIHTLNQVTTTTKRENEDQSKHSLKSTKSTNEWQTCAFYDAVRIITHLFQIRNSLLPVIMIVLTDNPRTLNFVFVSAAMRYSASPCSSVACRRSLVLLIFLPDFPSPSFMMFAEDFTRPLHWTVHVHGPMESQCIASLSIEAYTEVACI